MNGLCECGCGTKTTISTVTSRRDGSAQGQSKRFIVGHQRDLRSRRALERNKLELIGKRFGALIVQDIIYTLDKSGTTLQVVKSICDCGKPHTVKVSSLRKGKIRSCGCSRGRFYRKTLDRRLTVPQNYLPIGEAGKRKVYYVYQLAANRRHMEFSISFEDFSCLMQKNCHYCGQQPATLCKVSDRGSIRYNGIDRVDNERGYLLSNVVPCCKACNLSKGTMTKEQFLLKVEQIYIHSIERSRATETIPNRVLDEDKRAVA